MTGTRTYPCTLPTAYTVRGNAVVRRIDLDLAGGAVIIEVSVWRTPAQRTPTFQGEVQMIGGQWQAKAIAHDRTGERMFVLGSWADYADAETALVRHRSGHRSAIRWTGPRPTRAPVAA
jgi:hypothetical protein